MCEGLRSALASMIYMGRSEEGGERNQCTCPGKTKGKTCMREREREGGRRGRQVF